MPTVFSSQRQAAVWSLALACVLVPALAQSAPTPAANAAGSQATPSAPAANIPVLDAHTREDIARHQAMAQAHAQAAQCLESGQLAKQCLQQLQTACKGLALGKNCGMRHSH